MDFADACLVDMANVYDTGRILTLDSDFRIYRWARKRPFESFFWTSKPEGTESNSHRLNTDSNCLYLCSICVQSVAIISRSQCRQPPAAIHAGGADVFEFLRPGPRGEDSKTPSRCPVLALYGDKDLLVRAVMDALTASAAGSWFSIFPPIMSIARYALRLETEPC
jgi:hypothetical protein